MKTKALLFVLPFLLSGCFRPVPGGLAGVWEVNDTFDTADTLVKQTLRYTFTGDQATRIFEQNIRLKATGDSVVLRAKETGTISVDTGTSPNHIDVADIQQIDYPTKIEFATAGAITGNSASLQESFFDETLGLTFQSKGAFSRSGNSLDIKFGAAAYPADLNPPFVFTVQKAFALFP